MGVAKAVEHGHGRHGQLFQPGQDALAPFDVGHGFGHAPHLTEFGDIGPGDEAVGLARTDHQALGGAAGKALQDTAKLFHDGGG